MEIHRTEEETVEYLKQWIRDNGLAIIVGVIIGLSGIVGVRYWFDYQRTQAEQASLIYDKVFAALAAQKYGEVIAEGKQLQANYGRTSYAVLAALAVAKASYAIGDAAAARDQLAWVIKEADDDGMKHVARIRLARLFVDAKDYSAALKLITDQPFGAFSPLYEELRGDIYVAQNNPDLAREAYRQAVVGEQTPERRQFIQMKLDNLATDIKPATAETSEVIKK